MSASFSAGSAPWPSCVVEPLGLCERTRDLHNPPCCQFRVAGARTAEAHCLAIPFEPSLSGFLPLSLRVSLSGASAPRTRYSRPVPTVDDLLLNTVIIDAAMACCGHDDRRGTSGGHEAQAVQR